MDPTYVDTIVAAVDFSNVITGIGTIAAAIAGVYIVSRGAKMLFGMIGR